MSPRVRSTRVMMRLCGVAFICGAVTATLGCTGGDSLTPYSAPAMEFRALTDLHLTVDGQEVSLPYAQGSAEASLVLGGGEQGGCLRKLTVNLNTPDGRCPLTLEFERRPDGPGAVLSSARLQLTGEVGWCTPLKPWATAGGETAQVWEDHGVRSWTPWVSPAEADVTAAGGLVRGLMVENQSEIKLIGGAVQGVIAPRALLLGGDVPAILDEEQVCPSCEGAACSSAYPPIALRDVQPKSPLYQLMVPLDRWLGRHLVVVLTQGW